MSAFSSIRLRLAHAQAADLEGPLWQVQELGFFTDINCTQRAGFVLADSSVGDPAQAFDEDAGTGWTASCTAGVDSWKSCQDSKQLGAWLGVTFASPTMVRCLRLNHNGAAGFILETLQSQWQPWRQFAYAAAGQLRLRIPLEPVCNPEMVEAEEGVIDLPQCAALTQWRLWGPQVHSWTVYELHFFVDDTCTQVATGTVGLPFAQSGALETWQRIADGDLATAWSVSTNASAAWVGAAFNRSVAVRCVRIAQFFESVDPENLQILEAWNGTNWVVEQVLSGETPRVGHFQFLPPRQLPGNSQWRLVNTAAIRKAWAVHELSFASDVQCTQPLSPVEFVSSDSPWRVSEVAKAFDGSSQTAWVSSCAPCLSRSAFLGQRFEATVLVRCVNLRHAQEIDYRPASLDLERWDEGWRFVASFRNLFGGTIQLSPTWEAAGTRFVVSNRVATLGGWRLAELRLYRDEACVSRVRGAPFAVDGNSAEAEFALDGNLNTFWFANCCNMHGGPQIVGCSGCNQDEARVGVLLPQNDTVMCLQLIQRGELRATGEELYAAKEIDLLEWNGFGFERVYGWKNVPPDEWIEMGVGRDITALGAARGCSDFPEWNLCNASDWNCSRYQQEELCNETYQDDVDCEGITMAFACKASCCLCGAGNPVSCGVEGQEEGLPAWLIPAAAGGGSVVLCSVLVCCCCYLRRRAKSQ